MSNTEPFPELTPFNSNTETLVSELRVRTTQRRKGSSLGDDPRGDTAAPALATLFDNSPPTSTYNSPVRVPR
jgi:hypothetical protein